MTLIDFIHIVYITIGYVAEPGNSSNKRKCKLRNNRVYCIQGKCRSRPEIAGKATLIPWPPAAELAELGAKLAAPLRVSSHHFEVEQTHPAEPNLLSCRTQQEMVPQELYVIWISFHCTNLKIWHKPAMRVWSQETVLPTINTMTLDNVS